MTTPTVQVASAFKPLFKPMRYKVFYGGRGGAKSYAFAQALILRAIQSKTLILCTREFQGSIQDSVHRMLVDRINDMGLGHFFDIQRSTIIGKNGSEFIFEGLRNNVTKIKSMEGVDICWCEEAENISEHSWDVLIPTIRKPGSEIWVSFNPAFETDSTYQRFILNPPHDSVVIKVNYSDNPWFPEELRKEMEECKERDTKKYRHIWMGECFADYEDSIIQPEWVEAAIDAHEKIGFKAIGAKTLGFDPADGGSDSKAIAVRHGSIVSSIQEWTTGELPEAIDRAFTIAFDNRCDAIIYDSVGIGAGMKVHLDKATLAKKIEVQPFGGGEKPMAARDLYGDKSNEDTFRNRRAQGWWLLRDRLEKTYHAVEKGLYSDPDDLISLSSSIENLPKLKAELVSVQRKWNSSDLIQLVSKQQMDHSPNMGDALMMAFMYEPKEQIKPVRLNFATHW